MRPPINNPASAPDVTELTEDVAGGSHQRMVRLFPRGLPKRRPKDEYIHSTCGCWQCAYCASVKAARKRRDERLQLWDSINKQPNVKISDQTVANQKL